MCAPCARLQLEAFRNKRNKKQESKKPESVPAPEPAAAAEGTGTHTPVLALAPGAESPALVSSQAAAVKVGTPKPAMVHSEEIGRASCRERV